MEQSKLISINRPEPATYEEALSLQKRVAKIRETLDRIDALMRELRDPITADEVKEHGISIK